jgi:hypothetical protein
MTPERLIHETQVALSEKQLAAAGAAQLWCKPSHGGGAHAAATGCDQLSRQSARRLL